MDKQLSQALFGHLLMSLAQSALMGMGKIVHPAVGKAEVDLEAAQQAIDMLEMLQERTKGNLSSEEERGLTQTLSMLQMNFVETAQSQPKQPESKPVAETGDAPEPIISRPDSKTPPAAEGDDKVRYRKSYG
jgi:hypothetical protein